MKSTTQGPEQRCTANRSYDQLYGPVARGAPAQNQKNTTVLETAVAILVILLAMPIPPSTSTDNVATVENISFCSQGAAQGDICELAPRD
jgi:hypothetical protein